MIYYKDGLVVFLCMGTFIIQQIHGAPTLSDSSSSDNPSSDVKIGILEEAAPSSTALVGIRDGTRLVEEGSHNRRAGLSDAMFSFYPECPKSCPERWIGDGWCDTACAKEECGNDGGDCEGWCAPDCRSGWIDDGHCDADCFRPECNYDGADCNDIYIKGELKFPLPSHDGFDYSKCPDTCSPSDLHNDICNDACNVKECNFDGTDCLHQCSSTCVNQWLGDDHCDIGCNNTACGFDKGDCTICSAGCEPGMVGNGICDPQCNNDACYMDMGDCFGVCWSPEKVDYFTQPFFYPHCRTEWKGDGSCDCFCMNQQCDYDFGDCSSQNCSREYQQLHDMYKHLNLSTVSLPDIISQQPSSLRRRVLDKINTAGSLIFKASPLQTVFR